MGQPIQPPCELIRCYLLLFYGRPLPRFQWILVGVLVCICLGRVQAEEMSFILVSEVSAKLIICVIRVL